MKHFLACDLGAESGRLMAGTLGNERVELRELHRFSNVPLRAGDSLHWNIDSLFEGLQSGLRAAARQRTDWAGISTDSWGVDYILLDARGEIIAPTFHYRDPRGARGMRLALERLSKEVIFAETGIQFIPINALFQLATESRGRITRARTILGVGDAFNHWLSGVARAEVSLASTLQLYNPRTRDWSGHLLDAFDLPRDIFPPLVPSGTVLGPLRPSLAAETELNPLPVVAGCSHDTGAAVVAVPVQEGRRWAYLSSGTWSLLGVETDEPVINEQALALNFTNEIGFGGSVRLLKNLVGLWIVQECRRDWAARGENYDYATLARLAADAPPFGALIQPADPRFAAPDDMLAKIAGYCRETGQHPPVGPGPVVRCVLESLALLYRRTLLEVTSLTGQPVERLHIVGGGSQNRLLNQLTADATGVPVVAGPVEATALGNVLVQAIALGEIPSLAAARGLVARSFQTETFPPRSGPQMDKAIGRFEMLPV